MYNIFINTDFLDKVLIATNKDWEQYCASFDFDYNLFLKIYNNDLSVTLRELIKFATIFQIDMQNLLII
ncbi:MAG: hypothetical protein ACLRFE_01945 [Clostridia bacterium]